ncbi:MAG: hypothetical protein JWM37_279 [Candidatus Saccharibacteria bacterium]|nr:hypothetical protein [Candidatus Saccharibacteria bacterium]
MIRTKNLLKTGLLTATIGIGLALFAAPAQSQAAVSNWQKGTCVWPRSNGDFSSTTYKQSIDKLASDGANYVCLVVQLYQSNLYSTDIQAGWNTPTDQALRDGTAYAKSKGLQVAFNVHVDTYDGQWRAFINPGDKAGWFANYGAALNRYATLAQASGASQIVIGTEMSNMTNPSVSAGNTAGWIGMIQNVRSRFTGMVTYSAQHAGYMGEENTIGFWGSLDAIGVSAYYGLGNDSSVIAIKNQWANYSANLQALSTKYNKPVLFTEVGYQSRMGNLNDPGNSGQGYGLDVNLQANAYQALFDYWNNQGYMIGTFFWDWSSDPNAGGVNDNNYTPQNKPAETVMKSWFTNPTAGAPGGMGGGSTTPAAPTGYTGTATIAQTAVVNTANTITVNAKSNDGALAQALIDVEIYGPDGQRVKQQVYENQALDTAGLTYTIGFTPTSAGVYTVKLGIFTAGWQSNPYWNDSMLKFTAGQPTTTTPPPATTPPTTTPPPATTPTTPATASIDIWWPSNGAAVTGTQPFKAVIYGLDLTQYDMFWQVDGDRLNAMGDSNDGGAHKESLVDLTNWTWKASKQYTITFVAKDKSGATIATKSTLITVN